MDYKKVVFEIAKKLGHKFEEEVEEVQLASTELEDGTIVYSVDILDLGVQLFTDEAMETLLVDGEYITKDGVKFEVIDTVVGAIEEKEVEEPNEEVVEEEAEKVEQEETITEEVVEEEVTYEQAELTDGSFIYYDGELVVGTSLFTESGMTQAIEDGEYTTVNGEILVIVDGKIDAIRSIIEENAEFKKQIDEMNADNDDLTKQVEELSKQVELLKKTEINLKAEIDKKPATVSLQDIDSDNIKEDKEVVSDKTDNREFTRQILRQLKK